MPPHIFPFYRNLVAAYEHAVQRWQLEPTAEHLWLVTTLELLCLRVLNLPRSDSTSSGSSNGS